MAITATRRVLIDFSGDFQLEVDEEAPSNSASPGEVELVNLTTGATTITPPTGPTGVTIIPPSSNTTATITLKGVSGDTGIVLHTTAPTSIGLNAYTTTFVLVASTTLDGVRLVWS